MAKRKPARRTRATQAAKPRADAARAKTAARRRGATRPAKASTKKAAAKPRKTGAARPKSGVSKRARAATNRTATRKKVATGTRPAASARRKTGTVKPSAHPARRKTSTAKAPTRAAKSQTSSTGRRASSTKRSAGAAKRTVAPPASGRTPVPSAKAPAAVRRAPDLERSRRTLPEEVPTPSAPSSLNLDRPASAARSGRRELLGRIGAHKETSPAMTAGDVDADWEGAYSSGDEAPGGDNPTPDQDLVDEIGKAVGVVYEDSEELAGEAKISERDKHRWELDPDSAEHFGDEVLPDADDENDD